jgi:PPK2 family polyphosphate:nucleotide phosphotransferase
MPHHTEFSAVFVLLFVHELWCFQHLCPFRDTVDCATRRAGVDFSRSLPSIAARVLAMKISRKLVKPFLVEDGKHFRLKDHDPAHTAGVKTKEEANQLLQDGVAQLAEHQNKLYAQNSWALLLIFQAMDAAGKDGVIKHVMSGVNPQGCRVTSFKHPSAQELKHDFLWRSELNLPERGQIGIFNRSYYEEVLIVRVHPEILRAEGVPDDEMDEKSIWQDRYRSMLDLESHLHRNGTIVVKFFLHLSKEEQRKRFLDRIDKPEKNWKFSNDDVEERKYWNQYMKAYEKCLSATSTEHAPWYIVPADDKPNEHLIVSRIVLDTVEALKLSYPKVSAARRRELQLMRKKLGG